jgi:hypothetical protein
MSFFQLAPKFPESPRVSNDKSQTKEIDSGGSQEVKDIIISIGTKNSEKSASAQELVAD